MADTLTLPTKTRPHNPRAYAIAVQMQAVLAADVHNPKTPPIVRASLARAWDVLEDRKRVLRMKPKPADLPVAPAQLLKALKRAKVRAGGQGSIQRLLKEAEPIIESEPDEPPAHT